MSQDEEMPEQEAIWLALGIVTWGIALALAPTARRRFIDGLAALSEEHGARVQVVTFPSNTRHDGDVTRATRVAVSWIRRIVDEFRAAR